MIIPKISRTGHYSFPGDLTLLTGHRNGIRPENKSSPKISFETQHNLDKIGKGG